VFDPNSSFCIHHTYYVKVLYYLLSVYYPNSHKIIYINMSIMHTEVKVKIGHTISQRVEVTTELLQGDALSLALL